MLKKTAIPQENEVKEMLRAIIEDSNYEPDGSLLQMVNRINSGNSPIYCAEHPDEDTILVCTPPSSVKYDLSCCPAFKKRVESMFNIR